MFYRSKFLQFLRKATPEISLRPARSRTTLLYTLMKAAAVNEEELRALSRARWMYIGYKRGLIEILTMKSKIDAIVTPACIRGPYPCK
jgi:hypothetical protein